MSNKAVKALDIPSLLNDCSAEFRKLTQKYQECLLNRLKGGRK